MGIYRVKKNSNYVVLDRTALNDNRLSWKAKGIVSYMLSMPDDWTFYWEELSNHSTDGLAALKTGLKELKEHGYLVRFPVKDEAGKIVEWETIVYERPQVENPLVENPPNGNPLDGNSTGGKSTATNYLSLPSTDVPIIDKPSINIPYVFIVDYLNKKAFTGYSPHTKKTQSLIRARWNEGFVLNDFFIVIDKKVSEWKGTDMEKYLRPETLFGTKFEGYLNQKVGEQNGESVYDNLW